MFPWLRRVVILVAAVAAGSAGCTSGEPLSVTDARIREPTPGRTTTAAYFTLHNRSAETLILTGAASPAASSIEMHTMVERDGRVGMRRVPEVTVSPDERIEFAPGGLHLMVFGVKTVEAPFPISLKFADGTELATTFDKLSLVPGAASE